MQLCIWNAQLQERRETHRSAPAAGFLGFLSAAGVRGHHLGITNRGTAMNSLLLRPAALALAGALAAQIPAGGPYDCLTLRSDGHSGITFTSNFSPNTPLSSAAFTPADFAAACGGLPA